MQTIIYSGNSSSNTLEIAYKKIRELIPNFEKSPDFFKLSRGDGSTKIKVDDVRSTINFVSIKPSYSKYKVVFIENAEFLSIESQNTLLKTFEEPPEYAIFILTVNHFSNLLPTLLSRSIVEQVNSNLSNENESNDYSLYIQEYSKIFNSNLGERIDWLVSHKSDFSNRDFTVGLIDELILFYHLLIIHKNNDLDEDIKRYKDRLSYLFRIKECILGFNANPLLSLEAFLATI